MPLQQFPLSLPVRQLHINDLIIYEATFKEIVKEKIPTSETVQFLTRETFLTSYLAISEDDKNRLFRRICSHNRPEKINNALIIPLKISGHKRVVMLVEGLDPVVFENISTDWLEETVDIIVNDLMFIVRADTDPITSLYAINLLPDAIAQYNKGDDFHLVLVELFAFNRSPKDAYVHLKKAVQSLKDFNRQNHALFHLGQSIFALLIDNISRDVLKSYCLSLVTFIKDRGLKRVHCGSSSKSIARSLMNHQFELPTTMLDEAWSALHIACKRGPFAFCDYEFIANPAQFPLSPITRRPRSKLQRYWRQIDKFSLIYLRPDFLRREQCDRNVNMYLKDEIVVKEDSGYLVVRRNMRAEIAKSWTEHLVKKMIEEYGEQYSFSAGVSEYPLENYSKTEIIRNCQKALFHGTFYGKTSVVVFDALSLNISGDVFFAEGDLKGAVREYRCGLIFDPDDVNLLNSIGVAYALMNQNKDAWMSFIRVLEIEPNNFMALYNAGLGEQSSERYRQAVSYFKRALHECDKDDPDETTVLPQLKYYLGVALYHDGKYEDCIDLLSLWYNEQLKHGGAGKCCRYIGLSYYQLGAGKDSITWLQRGLRYDEFDAEAMSLLGELYLEHGEGNEIALRLCEKSREIDNKNDLIKLRYARALVACNKYESAIERLKECVRKKSIKLEAWYELAGVYTRLKQRRKAQHYVKNLLNAGDVPKQLLAKVNQLNKINNYNLG
ncbi:MAG: tetratricopeptide repeat protein [Deltaproteobacteria bacterium]|nr:tetratricopeptide repeat protein [Deltaproteobacteria bacterium]